MLTVRGEKRIDREQKKGGWHVRECAYGSFTRTVPLPIEVEPDRCSVHYRDGILRIELTRSERARPARTMVTAH